MVINIIAYIKDEDGIGVIYLFDYNIIYIIACD